MALLSWSLKVDDEDVEVVLGFIFIFFGESTIVLRRANEIHLVYRIYIGKIKGRIAISLRREILLLLFPFQKQQNMHFMVVQISLGTLELVTM